MNHFADVGLRGIDVPMNVGTTNQMGETEELCGHFAHYVLPDDRQGIEVRIERESLAASDLKSRNFRATLVQWAIVAWGSTVICAG